MFEVSKLFVCLCLKYAAPQVHLVFVEGAGHPVSQRAELPPHLGAFLHLLCSVLLVFIPAQTSRDAEINTSHLARLHLDIFLSEKKQHC